MTETAGSAGQDRIPTTAALQWTQGKAFTVDTSGAWSEAHSLLTWDPDARETAC